MDCFVQIGFFFFNFFFHGDSFHLFVKPVDLVN